MFAIRGSRGRASLTYLINSRPPLKSAPRLSLACHLVSVSPPFHPFPLSLSHIISSSTSESAHLIAIAARLSRSGSGPISPPFGTCGSRASGISTNYGTTCLWSPPDKLCKCPSACQVPRGQSQLYFGSGTGLAKCVHLSAGTWALNRALNVFPYDMDAKI